MVRSWHCIWGLTSQGCIICCHRSYTLLAHLCPCRLYFKLNIKIACTLLVQSRSKNFVADAFSFLNSDEVACFVLILLAIESWVCWSKTTDRIFKLLNTRVNCFIYIQPKCPQTSCLLSKGDWHNHISNALVSSLVPKGNNVSICVLSQNQSNHDCSHFTPGSKLAKPHVLYYSRIMCIFVFWDCFKKRTTLALSDKLVKGLFQSWKYVCTMCCDGYDCMGLYPIIRPMYSFTLQTLRHTFLVLCAETAELSIFLPTSCPASHPPSNIKPLMAWFLWQEPTYWRLHPKYSPVPETPFSTSNHGSDAWGLLVNVQGNVMPAPTPALMLCVSWGNDLCWFALLTAFIGVAKWHGMSST